MTGTLTFVIIPKESKRAKSIENNESSRLEQVVSRVNELLLHISSVKLTKITLSIRIFREINASATSLVKMSVSRNFCEICT